MPGGGIQPTVTKSTVIVLLARPFDRLHMWFFFSDKNWEVY